MAIRRKDGIELKELNFQNYSELKQGDRTDCRPCKMPDEKQKSC